MSQERLCRWQLSVAFSSHSVFGSQPGLCSTKPTSTSCSPETTSQHNKFLFSLRRALLLSLCKVLFLPSPTLKPCPHTPECQLLVLPILSTIRRWISRERINFNMSITFQYVYYIIIIHNIYTLYNICTLQVFRIYIKSIPENWDPCSSLPKFLKAIIECK